MSNPGRSRTVSIVRGAYIVSLYCAGRRLQVSHFLTKKNVFFIRRCSEFHSIGPKRRGVKGVGGGQILESSGS